tara:strand:+ start:1012 stop:1878 length:867 start_codon:yes stop_codon:yes gene_type:complete
MKIKHSKYKNTGILFELLVRQITADTLKGGDSPAIDVLKEHFVKTALGREYKLYESILKSKTLTEGKANMVISTILESSQKFNRTLLRKQKYNLINEIKKHYDLDVFFGSKIKNYKELASLYTLIEGYNSQEINDSQQLIDNKISLLEHLTKQEVNTKEVKEDVLKEFQTYDKDLRILTYKVLLEKFNSKYDNLSSEQKQVLKEFINSVDSAPGLRDFYNSKIKELKSILNEEAKNIKDKATQIKITEVTKYLVELDKTSKVNNDNLVDLLQYFELVKEIKVANGIQI